MMEMEYQGALKRNQDKVSSNQTAVFEAKITHWYEDETKQSNVHQKPGNRKVTVELQNWEELYTIPDSAELLQKLHRVPFYRYMIRYLVYTFSDKLEEEAQKQGMDCSNGWEERYAGYLIAQRESEKETDRLRMLTDLVWNAFETNGCGISGRTPKVLGNLNGTKKWNYEDLETVLFGKEIRISDFFALAFGLDMNYEDLTMFLQKVLKRSQLNLWNEDEFLIYICFQRVQGRKIDFYRWAKQEWKVLPEKKGVFEIPGQTTVLRTQLDQMLTRQMSQIQTFCMEEFNEQMHDIEGTESAKIALDAIRDLLSGYKYLLGHRGDYKRTALRCAGKRLTELKTFCQEDMEEYLTSMKEEQNYAHGTVRVSYDAAHGICIPEGTRFFQKAKDRDGNQETVWYTALSQVCGEKMDEVETDVTVICTEFTCKHEKNKDNTGYLPNKTALKTDLDGIHTATASHALSKPIKKKSDPEDAYHVSGVIKISCKPGLVIPKQTAFYANGFTYVTTKEIICETVAEVPVRCEKENWEATINQIQNCESQIEGMIRVGNTKISLRSARNEEENRTGGTLYRYLYTPSEDLICGDNSISDKNTEYLPEILEGTMFSATKLWQIEKQKDVEITRNDILTLSFLSQMAEIEFDQSEYMEIQAQVNEADTVRQELFEDRYAEFLHQTNRDLSSCGFQGLYLANPYDCLLAYMTTCSEPLTAFRNLWAVYLDYQKNN